MPASIHDTEEKPRRAVIAAVHLHSVSEEEFQSSLAELRALAKTLGIEVVGQITQRRSSFHSGGYFGAGKRKALRELIGAPPPEPDRADVKPEKKDARMTLGAAGRPVREAPETPETRARPEDDNERDPIEVESTVDEAEDLDASFGADDEDESGDEADEAQKPVGADTILVEHELSPSQARNLEKETGCDVLDRTTVILEIFHRHARSRAARAQVEIVRLQYLAPRLRETGAGKDRQRGGIGGKGTGESGLELDRRKIRDRVTELQAELESLEEERRTQRQRRKDHALLERVALVGYTNAGKSTLMRALTGSEVYVADKLFATLDTTVRTLMPETVPRILVSDTVGFIKNLPHDLVASFKSTLDEALEATLLAHVVDASDPGWERQLEVTESVLDEIGAREVPRLLVFNKVDRLGDARGEGEAERVEALLAAHPGAIALSARRPEDIARLHQAFLDFFSKALVEQELHVPWNRQALRGQIFTECQVLEERYDETGVIFRARAHPQTFEKLRLAVEA